MSQSAWMFAVSALLLLIGLGAAFYAIVQWIYSDMPRGTRRPWQRRRREPPADDGLRAPPPERHPLNAPGPFYTEKEFCLACGVPGDEAPDLIAYRLGDGESDDTRGCYFKKQPETPEELERALQAMRFACCGAYRYGGTDPEIIQRLHELRVDLCQIDNLDTS